MEETKQLTDTLDICQQHIGLFLKHAHALKTAELNVHERLMILAFYEELLALFYENCNLFDYDPCEVPAI